MESNRIGLVTARQAAAGAVAGGVVGKVLVTVLMALVGDSAASELGLNDKIDYTLLGLYGFAWGAVAGAVLGPLAAWLLRRVPRRLAVGGTALGTLAGAAAGLYTRDVFSTFAYTLSGFVLSAGALWILAPRGSPRAPSA